MHKRDSYAREDRQQIEPDALAHLHLLALRDLSLAMINTNEFVYLD